MIRDFIGDWKWMAVRGAAALLFGVATLVWPHVTLFALVMLWGAFALVDGLALLLVAVAGGAQRDRGWTVARGLAGIFAGGITLAWPSITALALMWLIGLWALVTGLVGITAAVRMHRVIANEWALGIAGGLSIILALILFFAPGTGALAITWAIGWFATFFGMLGLGLAYRAWHEGKSSAAPTEREHLNA
ncbi:MAG: DUF308 domain-containing protein [Actinomycetota bacterium]|nr:DUF308 domain-containing protein [Actinomycetota bacterium]